MFQILCKDIHNIIDKSVVRSALDDKHRNRRIKFEDVVEEKIETLDIINLFELPKNIPDETLSTDSSDDNNILVMGDKDLSNDNAIVKHTRSRTRMVFSASALNLEKPKSPGLISLILLVPYLVLFFLKKLCCHYQLI